MLTAISQKLRTPLAGILGASVTLECAGGRMSEEATAELLRGLSSSARKLDRLLTNLLDLEQLGWGTIPLNRQPFDVAALLEQVASRWRNETPWPQVCASSTTVWLDRDKVERIVEELLANTARHTHRTLRSGFVPTVRAPACAWRSRTPAQACRARCARRCSSATATARPPLPTPGLGVGLLLVLRLAQLHGGTAWVEDRQAVAHRSRSPCQSLLTDTGQSALPSAAGPIGWPNRSPELGAVTVAQREIGSLPNECVAPERQIRSPGAAANLASSCKGRAG